MMRSPFEVSGFGPFIQQRRMPFFRSMVVMVAVVTLCRMSNNGLLIAASLKKSCRRHADPRVAAAQPGHQRNREENHPALADHLAEQKIERAEGKPQKYDRVDHEP